MRSGALTNSKVLGSVKKNDKADILGETGSWYKINFKGKNGYVSKDYVKKLDIKVTTTTKPQVKVKKSSFDYYDAMKSVGK